MREQEAYNAWEGFDGNQQHYDEKKEKQYQARIWWCLGLIGLGIFISLIVNQIKYYQVTQTYQCIEAEYVNDNSNRVHYYNDDGVEFFYEVPSHPVKGADGKVFLYYEEDCRYVRTVDTFLSWLPQYLFFTAITLFSIWKLQRIYRKPQNK